MTKKFDAMQKKIKFQAFGKTKPRTENAKKRRLVNSEVSAGGMETVEERGKRILQKQSETIEAENNKIKEGKHGRVTNVFKMVEL